MAMSAMGQERTPLSLAGDARARIDLSVIGEGLCRWTSPKGRQATSDDTPTKSAGSPGVASQRARYCSRVDGRFLEGRGRLQRTGTPIPKSRALLISDCSGSRVARISGTGAD